MRCFAHFGNDCLAQTYTKQTVKDRSSFPWSLNTTIITILSVSAISSADPQGGPPPRSDGGGIRRAGVPIGGGVMVEGGGVECFQFSYEINGETRRTLLCQVSKLSTFTFYSYNSIENLAIFGLGPQFLQQNEQ